jgi:hypothetical protein
LSEQLMLAEELDRLVAGAMDTDLSPAENPEAILEAYLRATVRAETVREQVAEVPLAEGACEAMRDAECARILRHAQRRRKADEGKVRLARVDGTIARR